MIIALVISLVIIAALVAALFFIKQKTVSVQPTTVNTDIRPFIQQIEGLKKQVNSIPDQTLQVITGSANTGKGKLGELIGFISLKSEYDRIIPMGSICDFIGIKLPDGDNPGSMDFIDIKTGSSARLSKDQRGLKNLIERKLINFKTVKIDTVEGFEDERSSTD